MEIPPSERNVTYDTTFGDFIQQLSRVYQRYDKMNYPPIIDISNLTCADEQKLSPKGQVLYNTLTDAQKALVKALFGEMQGFTVSEVKPVLLYMFEGIELTVIPGGWYEEAAVPKNIRRGEN